MDMIRNSEEWFAIFDHELNHRYAERCIVILGSLATIHRQRGDLIKCAEVLELDKKVLDRYEWMERNHSNFPWPGHAEELAFRYSLIAMNANIELKKKQGSVNAFRAVAEYEIRHNRVYHPQKYAAYIIPTVLGPAYDPIILNKLARLTDEELWGVIRAACNIEKEISEDKKLSFRGPNAAEKVPKLKDCALCNKTESNFGEFQRCSVCNKTYYCCRAHQKSHWKLHKKVCKSL